MTADDFAGHNIVGGHRPPLQFGTNPLVSAFTLPIDA
jgi:hypothetical protein